MKILGIESSCDETAASVVERLESGRGKILSNIVLSQIEQHAEFGGVVPEIAARAHLEGLDAIIVAALDQAKLSLRDMDAIAVTAGPGLIGGVMVGLMTAKALSATTGKPLIAINHLEGHALTPRLTDNVSFPYLLLLASGGHTQLLLVKGVGRYTRLATTIDDALGEAFDKTAKLLGLSYPGGPAVEQQALMGDEKRFAFPRPLKGQRRLDFSFSGLKTAVRQQTQALAPLQDKDIADICASFQQAVVDVLRDRVQRVLKLPELDECDTLVVAGGVAANLQIRTVLEQCARDAGRQFVAPPLALCTDNAAMIAWAGAEHFALGHQDNLDVSARPRWPLDENAANKIGSGRRGVKV
jgi:N6-L-threonylcarbamoyladenine synthase